MGYALRRILQAVPLLFGVSLLCFLLLQMTPGGPLSTGEGASNMSEQQLAALRAELGLDDPLPVRYLNWVGGILTGDWGESYRNGRPVLELVAERVPVTLGLTLTAFVVSILLAVPIGVLAARRKNSLFDHVVTGASFAGLATPSFWLGIMLLLVFSYGLGWFPAQGISDLRAGHQGIDAFWDTVRHLVLPVTVLALISTAQLTRYVRASMLEVLDQDYIRTARAAGLLNRTVVFDHGLRAASIPVVTVAMLSIPELFLGAVVTETVFSIPGMGRLFVDSAGARDYPVLLGILVVASVLVILANLAADLLYAALDPRIRHA
ncbi:ABC transporter permease [Agromyces silvae]|uniref:ABC transporter permease n=1 Tax=Agromyces silvae TaxID=3388266 RepID=UPI00280B8E45|nr:ABC transporter permease [Agromyces protaetiae]